MQTVSRGQSASHLWLRYQTHVWCDCNLQALECAVRGRSVRFRQYKPLWAAPKDYGATQGAQMSLAHQVGQQTM